MKQTLAVILFLIGALNGFAQGSYQEVWNKANTLYQQKEYGKAAALYEQLAARKPAAADVYYNLGNTYYKLNKPGAAVLNYKRALKMDPGYQKAQDNLELAESRIPNRVQAPADIFFVAWWKEITDAKLAEVWAIVALVLFVLSLVILSLQRLQKAPRWMGGRLAVAGLSLSGLFLLFGYTAGQRKAGNSIAVVMHHDAPLVNSAGGKSQTAIPEGTVVNIVAEQGDMLEVNLPDGRQGWMNKQLLQRI